MSREKRGKQMESGMKDNETPESADQVLSHPLRSRMAAELQERAMSPAELAEALDEPLHLVSYHYRVLTAAGSLRLADH
jgi:DNA-binding transcriptional ArsR family regulator